MAPRRAPDFAPAPGAAVWSDWFDRDAQAALVEEIRGVAARAPFFTPVMPGTAKPFSVRMTNCGPLGWVSDRAGYRYQPRHPDGAPWPAIPERLLATWRALTGCAVDPDACLVNYYAEGAKMGLHQDRDEETFDAPILSISLGDEAVFRLGGAHRRGRTRSFPPRPGASTLLPKGGRINLTLRRVRPF